MYRIDYTEMAQDAKRELENERDKQIEKAEQMNNLMNVIDVLTEQLTDKNKLKEENETLQQQLAEERRQRLELEMKMKEMSKLSAGVAKKSSQEDVLKALRTYVNRSKRKTADKRAFAKTAILEIANANGLVLPEDLASMIDSLDDEQTETKVVNVSGNYNDIHDNGEVKGIKA